MDIIHDDFRARWDSDGYSAEVNATGRYRDGKEGFRWHLYWPGGEAHSPDDAMIWAPEAEPIEVLASLASFLSAWEEGLRYQAQHGSSENGDLFPGDCLEFVPAIEEFAVWAYDLKNAE